MKTRKLLALTAAAIAFAACNKDNADNNPIPTLGGEPTTARIVLTQAGNGTYAAPANAQQPTAEESTINTATLYVFNSTRTLEQVVDLTVTAGVAEEVFETTTGDKYFYAAINIPSSYLTGISTGTTTTSQLEKKLVNVSNIAQLATDDQFWMTNVTTPAAQNLVKATQQEAIDGTFNNFTIPVGRASVKVNLEFAPTEQLGGTLTQVEYRLRNNPNQMYLMPVYSGGILQTPYFNDATVTASQYFDTSGFIPTMTPTYGVENSNSTPKEGNATYISLKGTFTPAEWMNADGTTNNTPASEGANFWRVANVDGTGKVTSYEDGYYSALPDASQVGANQQAIPYTAGECYYAIWIKDPSATGNVQKYTVKRNNYYWITVNSVNGAGWSDEDGVDPEQPLDEETWMKATIEVIPWVLIEYQVGI